MKTLIVSDIHNRTEWIEPFLAREPHDEVVFLGDYWDDFGDTPNDAKRVCDWLAKSVREPKRVHLWGNHDLSYRQPHNYPCSGWNPAKEAVISAMPGYVWKRLRLVYECQGYLLSHAGVHICTAGDSKGLNVARAVASAKRKLARNEPSAFLAAGRIRGGRARWGGVTWLDWNHEFEPIPGLKQIVGHTTVKEPEEKDGNWNLDTKNQHFGVLEDGVFSYHTRA